MARRAMLHLPIPVRLFLLVAFLLDAAGLAYAKVSKLVLHRGFPYNSVWLRDPPFTDLMFARPLFQHLHTAAFFSRAYAVPFLYPAALAPLFGFLLKTSRPALLFGIGLLISVVVAAALFSMALYAAGLPRLNSILLPAAIVCLSYPLAFDFKQGNTEIFVWVLVAAAVWMFHQRKEHAAALFIGCAIAMKIFPFVYLGLFLARQRYWPILTALATAAAVTLLSLLYIGPTLSIAWHGTANNLAYYQQTVPLAYRPEIGYDHSIFALIKSVMHACVPPHAAGENYAPLLRGYMLTAAAAGIALYFLRIRKLPVANQVLCLTICSVILPPTSYDYTLLHLYIPLALLTLFAIRCKALRVPGLNLMFLTLAVATSIETEFILKQRTFGAQIKCLALLLLLFAALRYPLRNAAGEEPGSMA